MSKYTAVYKEDDDGFYELLLITTKTFQALPDRELWLIELAQELAAGDLWAIQMVSGESLLDFPPLLKEDSDVDK